MANARPGVRWCIYINEPEGVAFAESAPYGTWLPLQAGNREHIYLLAHVIHQDRYDAGESSSASRQWLEQHGWVITFGPPGSTLWHVHRKV